ncbi:hypothetical protein GFS60_08019 (plasmid) [Rhodococcus sp. WAY2]|nr:hypothetical protein GFS60_08019 [Rhodococcus sp. WAY2]
MQMSSMLVLSAPGPGCIVRSPLAVVITVSSLAVAQIG